jgi:hypothetical protein
MTIDRATQALLELVAVDREQKCAAILDEARGKASMLVQKANADARMRVRATFVEERERMTARIGAAEAMLATKRRLALQRRAAALVAAGWERLPEALQDAWRDPSVRRAWVERITAEAQSRFPKGTWRIVHAPDWPAGERNACAAQLAASGVVPEFIADARVRGGLKIAAAGNVLDGTAAGLLADSTEIGALLLRELDAKEAAG